MKKDARIDSTGLYRYWLLREWNPKGKRVVFVMLNPSTADGDEDDPTLRKCIEFAKSWDYGGLEVVNLFAYRATEPDELRKVKYPVGSENELYLKKAIEENNKIIIAWGKDGSLRQQDKAFLRLISNHNTLYCLGMTKAGHPRHPLYVKGNKTPEIFEMPPLQLMLDLGI